MDKYEFNIKAEQMRKMAEQGDYKTAMQIADTIDWRPPPCPAHAGHRSDRARLASRSKCKSSFLRRRYL